MKQKEYTDYNIKLSNLVVYQGQSLKPY